MPPPPNKVPNLGLTRLKSPRPISRRKLKNFQLRGLGWCGEVTAHMLSARQVKKVEAYAKENGEDIKGISGSLEGVLSGYNCYDTNLWQSGVLPFLHGTSYVLVDSKNKIIHKIDNLANLSHSPLSSKKRSARDPLIEIVEAPSYSAELGRGRLLVYTEEHKGTAAVWDIKSPSAPHPRDLTFRLGRLRVAGEDTLFVEAVLLDGRELERNYDEEMIVGKASYSQLL